MTARERAQVLAAYVALGLYYRQSFDDVALRMYADDLDDLPLERVLRAMQMARRDPKRRMPPLPAELRDLCAPAEGSINARANELAGRITYAISHFGYTQTDRARAYVGELGWRVFERLGGYINVCQTVTSERMGTFFAQTREQARCLLEMPCEQATSEHKQLSNERTEGLTALPDLIARVTTPGIKSSL